MNRQEAAVLGGKAGGIASHNGKLKRINEYNFNPTLCKSCGISLDYSKRNNKFCSKTCAARLNNVLSPKRQRSDKWKFTECLQCGIVFEYNISNYRGKYCSNKCQMIYRWIHDTKIRVEQGTVTNSPTLKRYLQELRGNVCEVCNYPPTHNGKSLVLQLDHIDGNSDNNNPINLRLLCPNCHSQTETFTSRQRKNTRRNRYLRKFKSYAS